MLNIINVVLMVTCFFSESALAFDPSKLWSFGENGPWNILLELSDANVNLYYEVDTSLHLVSGVAHGIHGKVWLENKDPLSVRALIQFPVAQMSSGNDSRDRKMYKVMRASQYPEVSLIVEKATDLCLPESLHEGQSCPALLSAAIQIAAISKKIDLPIVVKKIGQDYLVSGTTNIKWRDYQIEDPSTFLAKLKEDVKISFSCKLSR